MSRKTMILPGTLVAALLVVAGIGQSQQGAGAATQPASQPTTQEALAKIGVWDGHTPSATLAGPYEDPLQQDVPFGQRSYYLAPWRAYMDTWPASQFLNVVGINFNVTDKEAPATAEMLAGMGVVSGRVEIGWGSFKYDDPNLLNNPDRLRASLVAMKANGIRPLILLNANAGAPVPMKGNRVKLLRPVQVGDREIYVDKTDFIVLGRTGMRGQGYPVAFPLILKVDANTGRCELSAPIAKPLSEKAQPATMPTTGPARQELIELDTLRFEPFGGVVFEDGSPNPAAQETADGWMTYVRSICGYAKEYLGTEGAPDAGFDLEVWNEYTFGSQFLDEKNYYDPARKYKEPLRYTNHGRKKEGHEVILPMTIDYAADANNHLPGVKVIDGFSNQRPWENGTDMWPGQAGFSRHYYTGMSSGKIVAPGKAGQAVVDAQGIAHTDDNFVPIHCMGMPEYWHYAYQTEFMTRDIQPFPGPWSNHYRYSHPGTGRAAEVWMTETNCDRSPWCGALAKAAGCDKDDPRLLAVARFIAAKAMLRMYTFYAHKGVHTIEMFAAKGGDTNLGIVADAFFTALKEANYVASPDLAKLAGPQVEAISRVTKLMKTGQHLDATRALTVDKLVEPQPRLVFQGDGTPGHPDRYNRDDFAVLPFQLDEKRFAVGFYVITRSLGQDWDATKDLLDVARYDMPAETFELTLSNARGQGAKVQAFDPLTNETKPVEILAATPTTITVRLQSKDYPRFLLIDEDRPGPMIVGPRLTPIEDLVGFRVSTNSDSKPEVTWGPILNGRKRELLREMMESAKSFGFLLPRDRPDCGVRATVEANGLTVSWPRWPWDTQGVAFWSPRNVDPNSKPPHAVQLPPLPVGDRPADYACILPASLQWSGDKGNQTLTLGAAKDIAVSLKIVQGDQEAVIALMPEVSVMDKASIRRVQWNSAAGMEADFTLAPDAHPGMAQLRQQYYIAPLKSGWLVLSFQGGAKAIDDNRKTLKAIADGISFVK